MKREVGLAGLTLALPAELTRQMVPCQAVTTLPQHLRYAPLGPTAAFLCSCSLRPGNRRHVSACARDRSYPLLTGPVPVSGYSSWRTDRPASYTYTVASFSADLVVARRGLNTARTAQTPPRTNVRLKKIAPLGLESLSQPLGSRSSRLLPFVRQPVSHPPSSFVSVLVLLSA